MEFDAMRDYLLAVGDEPETVWIEGGTFTYLWGAPSLDDWWNGYTGDSGEDANAEPHGTGLTIEDMGWTREQAAIVRGQFGAMAQDWDDPAMDVYDNLPNDSGEDDE